MKKEERGKRKEERRKKKEEKRNKKQETRNKKQEKNGTLQLEDTKPPEPIKVHSNYSWKPV